MDAETSAAEIVQGTDLWADIRRGRVTASRVADIMRTTKTGVSASRKNYMAELICERLTGKTADRFVSAEMRWGTEREPEARSLYALIADVDVTEIGFVVHPRIDMSGASPDGFCGEDGEVQFKCPNTSTHLDTLLGASIDADYITQMQWGLACSGRLWCDFVSYDPRLPAEMQIFVKRMRRDSLRIVELETGVKAFLSELDVKISALRAAFPSIGAK